MADYTIRDIPAPTVKYVGQTRLLYPLRGTKKGYMQVRIGAIYCVVLAVSVARIGSQECFTSVIDLLLSREVTIRQQVKYGCIIRPD